MAHKFFFFVVVMLVTAFSTSGAWADLVGWYTFEGGNANDSSGLGNNGTVVGAPTFVTGGGYDAGDYCLFDGDVGDYIDVPLYLDPFVPDTNLFEDNMPQLTVGAWVRTDTATVGSNTLRVAIDADNGYWDRPALGFSTIHDGSERWTAWTGYGGSASHEFDSGPLVAGTVGNWVFLAAVYDNKRQTGSLYYDLGSGLQKLDTNVLNGKNNSRATTAIGGVLANAQWIGGIDDVFFLDEALTEAQITTIHADTKGTLNSWSSTSVEPDRNLVSTWNFESGDYTGWNLVAGSTNPDPIDPEYPTDAFGSGPTDVDWNENKEGTYYIQTYATSEYSNSGMGVLETDSFTLGENAKFMLTVGGGFHRWQDAWDPDTILATRDAATNQTLQLAGVTLERMVGTDDWEVIRDANGMQDGTMIEVIWDGLEAYEGDTVRIRIYDLDENYYGIVTADNFRYYAVTEHDIPGDTNGDKIVNDTDAAMVASHWGQTIPGGPSVGDFNNDGAVDGVDASIMAANWGDHNESGSEAIVPEPSVLILVLFGIVTIVSRRRL